jgi:hypothetical protein
VQDAVHLDCQFGAGLGEASFPDFVAPSTRFLAFGVSSFSCICASLTIEYRYGTFCFNNLVRPPPCIPVPTEATAQPEASPEEAEGLLSSSLDETAALPADLGQSGFDVVPEGQHAQAAAAAATNKSSRRLD